MSEFPTIQNDPQDRHSRAGGNPAIKNILRSSLSLDVVPLCGSFASQLDSRLRGNDETL